jgi:DNA-binding LacI/PurR family transcriptional regulator
MDVLAAEKKCTIEKTYEKIYEEIARNDYPVGTKLQPIRALAKKYNVSYLTAQKAVKLLQSQGALEAKPGDGIYVIGKPKRTDSNIAAAITGSSFKNSCRPRSKSPSLCIILPYWVSSRGGAAVHTIIKGILSQSDKHDWSVELLHNSGDESDNEPSHPDFLKKIDNRRPDGVIWLQPIPTHRMNIMRLVDRGYKVVVTGRDFRDIPVKSIHIDIYDMALKIAEYLSDCRPEEILMFTGPVEGVFKDPYSVDIVEALFDVYCMEGLNLPKENICQAGFSPELSIILPEFIANHKNAKAIICLHEHILSCFENLEKGGIITFENKIPLIDVSGIFNFQQHVIKNLDIKQVVWPLEEMGKAVVYEFEKDWITDFQPREYDFRIKISNSIID